MEFRRDKQTLQNKSSLEKKSLPNISLGLHTMPKTETGHFKTWLVFGAVIFIFVAIVIIFIL